jgi:hypothetical protein
MRGTETALCQPMVTQLVKAASIFTGRNWFPYISAQYSLRLKIIKSPTNGIRVHCWSL